MATKLLDVDPRELRVTSSSGGVVDPMKLQRQIAQYGSSSVGMPPIWAYEGSDGVLAITNGVTRARRIAKLAPGTLVRVDVIGKVCRSLGHLPRIGDLIP